MAITAPYGSWQSPITAQKVSSAALSLSEPCLSDAGVFWLERRPAEGGRQVIMQQQPDGTHLERLPAPYSAVTQVHEYGGGCYLVVGSDIYFSNHADQRLYRIRAEQITPVTPDDKALRFADFSFDKKRNCLYSVCEDHSQPNQVSNSIVALKLPEQASGQACITTLASGQDFYAAPRLHPDGSQLAWLSWCHPDMPWDHTQLWLADLGADGQLQNPRLLAGHAEESLCQPEWSDSGQLHLVSDRANWWNLYRQDAKDWQPLLKHNGDFGLPHWQFGMRTYGFLADGSILATCSTETATELWHLNAGKASQIAHAFSSISHLQTSGQRAVFIAGYPDKGAELVEMDCNNYSFRTLNQSTSEDSNLKRYLSRAEPIQFPAQADKQAAIANVYAYFYRPINPDYEIPKETQPPLIVISHGGPTAAASADLNLKIQFWTSRGFAVVDVNYRGSSGYGRAYRTALKGQWGLVDVEDCIAGARFLVQRGDADPDRLCIRGSSAGGYTTLSALTFHNLFKVGASYYGVGDTVALAKHTHKFEARYLDSLIGPYPDAKALYLQRSPIQHTDQLTCPIIFFQGLEDKIVPPEQAQAMVDALSAKKIPVAHVCFEGEAHGFVQAAHIEKALNNELAFYGKILDFTPAGQPQAPSIRNLPLEP